MKKYFQYFYTILISVFFIIIFLKEDYPRKIQNKIFNVNYETDYSDLYKNNKFCNTIMLGDSHIERIRWNELINLNICNYGKGGDKSIDVLERINRININNSANIFLMLGINDIYDGYEIDDIFNNYTNIIEIANQNQSNLFVHSILYVSSEKRNFKAVNKKVKKLNNKLYDYCVNNNIYFIDLNILLSDNNQLKNNYTTDGVHLNSDGYLVWLSVLKDEILN